MNRTRTRRSIAAAGSAVGRAGRRAEQQRRRAGRAAASPPKADAAALDRHAAADDRRRRKRYSPPSRRRSSSSPRRSRRRMQPVTISPDAAYPNGFADPADPFANEMRAYNDQQGGFDWGLLGLLGLLGLIPLIRGNGRVRTVYVERDDEPRRVVRRSGSRRNRGQPSAPWRT